MNVLLVEDDPGIGRFVSRGLSAESFAVQWVRTGQEGRERLRAGGFAAAILDLGLPDVDGLDLCGSLRREGVSTPILMLTARGALEDKLDGFRSGADDYLAKPFAFEELVARLRVLCERARPAQSLSVGDLSLNPVTRTITIGDRGVALPQREFDLLVCLGAAGGLPVRRDVILERVWGPATGVSDNTLDVYVGYLRRRLKALAGAPVIETVRGVGFRLALSARSS